ncbi:hypothetical protein IDM40_26130 [Nocardiopsis sp. HNM0947]|uniref:Lipoprotein n=1 Tax=Nocardiopsis coralli TaxID=2772213 RepID=A0ABR9PEA2_9ACTN|nr:hypothetical protein [Nocardiopsis coralli]MBE3002151.1 hypothetical protein [Nocardiopsis coralli]
MTTKGFGFLPVAAVAAALALASATTACEGDRASQDGTNPGEGPDNPPDEDGGREEIAHHSIDLGEEGSEVWDEELLGEAPRADLSIVDEGADVTSFELDVTGFGGDEFFLATAHVGPCEGDPEDIGDLYEGDQDDQEEDDQDTEEAPESETHQGAVMIQLGTDAEGNGTGQIQIDGEVDGDDIGSMVISADPTSGSEQPDPEDGEPVACMDVELES